MTTRDESESLREKQAGVREKQAGVREDQAGVREDQAGVREDQSGVRENKVSEREEVLDVRDAIVDRQYHTLRGYMKIILWVAVVLFVGTIVSLFRSIQLEASVKDLDQHTSDLRNETNAAKEAAVEARDTLQAAIDRGTENASSPTAVRDALLAIARIETHLCGGPCDQP